MLLEVDEWLLKRTVPSLHANFNQEINLKRYDKVRELACVTVVSCPDPTHFVE